MSVQRQLEEGRRLGDALSPLRDERPFVLAIPRGGVLVADALARTLHAPLDVLVAAKVVAGPSRVAIGAVAGGTVQVIDDGTVSSLGLGADELEALLDAERVRQTDMLARLRGTWPLPDLARRTVVLVDDAVITGLTMRAALAAIRQRGARRIVIATPLVAAEAVALRDEAHDLVFLESLAFALAARAHDAGSREPCPPVGDEETHDLIARELRDVGADPFAGLVIDGI